MNEARKQSWVVKAVGAGSLVLLLAAPTFAQSPDSRRGNDGSYDRRGNDGGHDRNTDTRRDNADHRGGDRSSNRTYRENERVTMQGRVSSMTRERDGYRVQLDNGRGSYWIPQSYVRNRRINVGISISLGGIFRDGMIYVDAVGWPGERGYDRNDNYGYGSYDRGYVSGVIERVDARNGLVWLRDRDSRSVIEVDLRSVDRRSRLDSRDLRRGNYVELSGDFTRGGIFRADRIESVDTRM